MMFKVSHFAIAAVATSLFMAACTFYDNYDIDLMPSATASVESSSSVVSSDDKSSSSKDKDSIYVVIVKPDEDKSSSSAEESTPKSSDSWVCGDSTVTRGDITYETVKIKDQCWLKKNLNYAPSDGKTLCYDHDDANCDTYGLLYNYAAASIACPKGWRLPTSEEIFVLQKYTGLDVDYAGEEFKAEEGWNGENGTNKLQFSALPGGKCDFDEECSGIGVKGFWWTSTEGEGRGVHNTLFLNADGGRMQPESEQEDDEFFSVRCVRD